MNTNLAENPANAKEWNRKGTLMSLVLA